MRLVKNYFGTILAAIHKFIRSIVYIVDNIIVFLPIVVRLTVSDVKFSVLAKVFKETIL